MKILFSILIVFVSLLYGLPHIINSNKLGQDYDPLVISVNSPVSRDKAFAYAPFVNYILKGHFLLKDVYTQEYSTFPTPFLGETFPSVIMAFLTLGTNSIDNAFVAADFIFPAIIFILLFLIARMFIENDLFALSTAFLTSIARDFISVIPSPTATYEYFAHLNNQNYHLFLSRNFHPQVTFVFFLLAFIFLMKIISRQGEKFYPITLGITFGLLAYSYFFYWTYFLFFYSLVICYFLIKRKKQILSRLIIAGMIFLLISSYYLINLFQFYSLPIAHDFILKSALEAQPFALTVFRYLFLSIFFLYLFKNKGDKYVLFFLIMVSAVIIAIASKAITGQDLETLHYLRRAEMQFATIGFFIIIYEFIKKSKKTVILISALILISISVFALRVQIISANLISDANIRDHNQESVFAWLNTNTPDDSVIGSLNTDLNSLLPVYTHNKVFFPPTDRTITPTDEGITRFSILANLLGIQTGNQKKMLQDKNLVTYLFIYQSYIPGQGLSVSSPRNLWAQDKVGELSSSWQQYLKNFHLDYVIVTPKELELIQPNTNYLQPETSINQYLIFKVNKT